MFGRATRYQSHVDNRNRDARTDAHVDEDDGHGGERGRVQTKEN